MIRIAYPSLGILGVLALGACSSGSAAVRRDVEPRLAHRSAPAAAAFAAGSAAGAAHGPSAGDAAQVDGTDVLPAPAAPARAPAHPRASAPEAVPAPDATPDATPDAGSADAPQPGRAAQLLRRVEQAAAGVRTMQADFTQRLDVALLHQSQQSRGKLYQKRPDRFLMRFTDPAGDVMVADGRHFWLYYPSTDRKQVIRTSLAGGAGQVDLQRQFLGNASARFSAVLGADEAVAGRPAYVLTLTPRGASQFRRLKIWADKGDFLVRRFEVTEQNESVRRIDLRNLRVNAPVADALFRFTPPAGTEVFDQ